MYLLFSLGFVLTLPVFLTLSLFSSNNNSVVLEFFSPQNFFSELTLSLHLDFLALLFFSAISTISLIVLTYSNFYINLSTNGSPNNDNRFLYLLFSFILSIFILVFASSWVTLILGWDGLGLSSFLLVIFYNNTNSLSGGLLTFLTNRLGDAFFIISFLNISHIGWFFIEFLALNSPLFFLALIILGAITNSAQFPFSSWLPAAMAAPTPVSSLVHSSTLVTAGVYVLIRFNHLLNEVTLLLSILSLTTMLVSGVSANLEIDFNKIVAMSTLSQLGIIIFTLSLGFWALAFFHLLFHAFFNSSLFLSTGSIIHEIFSIQDSRLYGNNHSSYLCKLFFIFSTINLIGFPFTLGFYSNDTLLSANLLTNNSVILYVFIISCSLTTAYSLRILFLGLQNNTFNLNALSAGENNFFIFPLLILFSLSVLCGNFFFTEFFFTEFLSITESLLGLLVLVLGISFNIINNNFRLLYNFFISIAFLASLSSNPLNNLNIWIPIFEEFTWSEDSTASGIVKLLKENINLLSNSFSIHLLPAFLILFLFLVI